MSCLNLRLLKAKKSWKSFTTKLHIKFLHKLTKSKSIKKQKIRKNAAKKPAFFLDQRINVHKKRIHYPNHPHCRYHLKKKSAAPPVYVDELFKGAGSEAVDQQKSVSRNMKLLGQEVTGEGMADDMWESVGLTSPQMFGIDQRAENFIVRVRAEMERETRADRRL